LFAEIWLTDPEGMISKKETKKLFWETYKERFRCK